MATATPAREKKLQMANDDVINNQFENDKVQDYEWPPNVSFLTLGILMPKKSSVWRTLGDTRTVCAVFRCFGF